jgi:protein gp37
VTRPTLTEALRLYGYTVHPWADKFPMMTDDEYEGLVASAQAGGWLNPVVINRDGVLIDGRNRLTASIDERVGLDVPVQILGDEVDEVAFIIDANLHRRSLTAGQRALIGAEYKVLEAEKATQRLIESGRNHGRGKGKETCPDPIEQPVTGQSRDLAAAKVGVSGKSVDKAELVLAEPDLADAVRTGATALEPAYQEARKRKEDAAKIEATPKPVKTPTMLTLVTHEGVEVPYKAPQAPATFNATNGNVDWAAWTWNPVTGCLHGCGYCYARELAHKPSYASAYPVQFTPLFHHERLAAPVNTKVPAAAADDPRKGRVFVCSMADLFGEWVPQEWIDSVFEAALAAPQWEYLFLTKFPQRYKRMGLPPKMWAGASVDTQARVRTVEKAMPQLDVAVRWLSIEPMLEPLTFTNLSWCDLIVIGSQTATVQPEGKVPAFAPPFRWVADLVAQADAAGVPVYLKPNLAADPGMALPTETPRRRT